MQLAAPPCSPSLPPPPTGVLRCCRPLVHIPVRTCPALSSLSTFRLIRRKWLHSLRVGLIKRKHSPILFENFRISSDLLQGARHSHSPLVTRVVLSSLLLFSGLLPSSQYGSQSDSSSKDSQLQRNSRTLVGAFMGPQAPYSSLPIMG